MSVGVDLHCFLYQAVWTVKELATGHNACIVDENVNGPKLFLDLVRSLIQSAKQYFSEDVLTDYEERWTDRQTETETERERTQKLYFPIRLRIRNIND